MKAIETVDECLGQVVEAVQESGGVCVITADHGNADNMLEPDGSPNTAHSMNPVPLIVTADVGELREGGILADVAPTVLALLGEEQPAEMTGKTAQGGLTPLRRCGPPSRSRARDGAARAGRDRHPPRRRAHAGVRAARLDGDRQVAPRERGRRARLRHGARQHVPPVHPARARADRRDGRPARVHGLGAARSSPTRAATRCSRWATARWPRRSSGVATRAQSMVISIEEEGVRFRSYARRHRALHGPRDLDGGAGRARLGHRARLRRVHALPRRARLHRALDGAHAPLARPLRGLVRRARARRASCSTGSCRAACTRTCARESTAYVAGAGVDGIAIGGSLGQEKEQMREVVGWALADLPEAPPRHLLGIGDVDDIVHAVGAGIDTFDCATPTRLARHGTALVNDPASRWRLDLTKAAHRTSREPIDADCPCPACREHTRGYLHYLIRVERADRQAPDHAPQPDLHGAADARAARRDRRRAPTPTRPSGCSAGVLAG